MKPLSKTFYLGMILATGLVVGLEGCAGKKTQITSTSLPTMKTLYQQKYGISPDKGQTTPVRTPRNHTSDWNAQVRDDLEPLYQEFRYLPNPLLTLYVFPHLTDAGTPVPGYTTFFKFYKTDQVGLVHEFPPLSDIETYQDERKKFEKSKANRLNKNSKFKTNNKQQSNPRSTKSAIKQPAITHKKDSDV